MAHLSIGMDKAEHRQNTNHQQMKSPEATGTAPPTATTATTAAVTATAATGATDTAATEPQT